MAAKRKNPFYPVDEADETEDMDLRHEAQAAVADNQKDMAMALADVKSFDLGCWERKALKNLRRFHTAAVRFESNAIPLPEQARIHAALNAALTSEDVRGAFKAVDPVDELITANLAGAVDWAREAMGDGGA